MQYNKSQIFFSSDWHLGHRNLVKCLSKWSDTKPCRDFASLEEMDNTIIDNINRKVPTDAVLVFFGDFAIVSLKYWPEYRRRINCKTIHLILGNHDPESDLIKNKPFRGRDGQTYLPSDLFASIKFVDSYKFEGAPTIYCSHYAHRTWNKAHHGSWMLYGHSHGSLEQFSSTRGEKEYKHKTKDVGIDTHPNFEPYSYFEIEEEFKKYHDLSIDHHTSKNGPKGSVTLTENLKTSYLLVKRLRKLKNIRQYQLAEMVGVSKHTILRIEKGETTSMNTLLKIFDVLGDNVEFKVEIEDE